MKPFLSSFSLSLGLLLPVLAACSGATVDEPANGTDGVATGASGSDPVETADADVKSGKKKTCPSLTPPSPAFCPDGKVVPIVATNGCTTGYACKKPTPADCPELVQPAPGFCPGGTITPVHDTSTGCIVGFDCKPAATNACTAAGGTCVGLSPSSCAAGHFADAKTYSCGGGLGVGCCMP